ncbi:hypothetical protein A9Q81_25420 [Gammaproteobacteria bacterium 42_54_T18]|nr:hypothetical protein A9Q81_25420 [Gammaproteobacteria bacterium 42_54_T18]
MKIHFALQGVIISLLSAVFFVVLSNIVVNKPHQDQYSAFTIYAPATPPPMFDQWLSNKDKE